MDKRMASMARQRAAAELASQGKYRCRFCQQVKPLPEGVVVTWGGNVMFALCPTCYPKRPIIMEQRNDDEGRPGLYVGFLRPEDHPADIVPVSSMSQLHDFASAEAIAKVERIDGFTK